VGDGGHLKGILHFRIQSLQLGNGSGICPHTDEVVDVVDVAVGKVDHLLHDLRDLHMCFSFDY
jgi:hypothetical protein